MPEQEVQHGVQPPVQAEVQHGVQPLADPPAPPEPDSGEIGAQQDTDTGAEDAPPFDDEIDTPETD